MLISDQFYKTVQYGEKVVVIGFQGTMPTLKEIDDLRIACETMLSMTPEDLDDLESKTFSPRRSENDSIGYKEDSQIEKMRSTRHKRPVLVSGRDSTLQRLGIRDGWHCFYCHTPLTGVVVGPYEWKYYHDFWMDGDKSMPPGLHPAIPDGYQLATIDHKLAKNNGGGSALNNLCLCCASCNSEKSDRYTADEFYRMKAAERGE